MVSALLAVDVGNTNTVLGLYEGRELKRHWRVTTRRDEMRIPTSVTLAWSASSASSPV